jgi:hypothetical protein
MSIAWRTLGIFALGAGAGAIAAGWAVYENSASLHKAAEPTRTVAQPMRQEAPCPGTMTLPASANDDARFELIEARAEHKPADVRAFIVIGQEAAASGRPRDAELAFIMACRVASKAGTDPVLLADAKYQLARHYTESARGRDPAFAKDLQRRARVLYGDSLRIYAVRLGNTHEKTTFASNALAALDAPAETVAAAAPPAVTPAGPPPTPVPRATAPRPAPESRRNDTRFAGAGPAPAARARPSFDCGKAHSRTEQLICADPQLAQLDRELGKLYAQAKAGSPNPADFRRRSDAQWKQREANCSNRECLLAWYAQRRTQLMDEIEAQHARGQQASAR